MNEKDLIGKTIKATKMEKGKTRPAFSAKFRITHVAQTLDGGSYLLVDMKRYYGFCATQAEAQTLLDTGTVIHTGNAYDIIASIIK